MFGTLSGTPAPAILATFGEGLVYVSGGYTGGAPAAIGGNVTANGLTKFGPGDLLLSGTANLILGNVTVQEGALKFGISQKAVAPAPYATNLVLNDTGTLDLSGQTIAFASLANSANTARSWSVKWFSTRTRIDSAISAAPKDFSSVWPKKPQIGDVLNLEVASSLTS